MRVVCARQGTPEALRPCNRCGRLRPALRHTAEAGHGIAQFLQTCHRILVGRLGDLRRARHDPSVVAVAATYDGQLVVAVDVDDHVFGLDRPDELHAPDRIVGPGHYSGNRVHRLELAVEGAFAIAEPSGDPAVGLQRIRLDRVECVALGARGDVPDDIPIANEALQVDLRHRPDLDIR